MDRTGSTHAPDGDGCPMAHCNLLNNSFHAIPPLRSITRAHRVDSPVISPKAAVNLGAYTGEKLAVCAYESAEHPALVAYDLQDDSVAWTSPCEDLPQAFAAQSHWHMERVVSGVLMATITSPDGHTKRHVFAATPNEIVAYTFDGSPVWKRPVADVASTSGDPVGSPRDLRFTAQNEIVGATRGGWIIKLNPVSGSLLDMYRMESSVFISGRSFPGTLRNVRSSVVVENRLYLVVEFDPDPEFHLHRFLRPVYVLRIDLHAPGARGAQTSIKPIDQATRSSGVPSDRVQIGVNQSGGSPAAYVRDDDSVVIFAGSMIFDRRGRQTLITAVEDRNGVMSPCWHYILEHYLGEPLLSAPALHNESGTLIVTGRPGFYVFRNATTANPRTAEAPTFIPAAQVVADEVRSHADLVEAGAPLALTFDTERHEIVVVTNFRATPTSRTEKFGFLGAFTVPLNDTAAPAPLWCQPLAVGPDGEILPGFGTYGQPALFQYRNSGNSKETGVIVNTVQTGTFIFK